MQENLIPIYSLANDEWEERPIQIEESAGGWEVILRRDAETDLNVWFKNSSRQFIDFERDGYTKSVEFSDDKSHANIDQVAFMDGFKGAWGIDDGCFRKAATEYKVDIRIFVWERGMQWSSVSTYFRDGHVEESSQTYADWLWDSALPNYGG